MPKTQSSTDSNTWAPCRSDSPALSAGMVVTIEPGIYFNRQHLERSYLSKSELAKYINTDLLEQYYPVGGVRIEDDILITESGYDNLTTMPKGDQALQLILDGFANALFAKVTNWHGLDPMSFGRLRKFATINGWTFAEEPSASFQSAHGYLFETIFLLVKAPLVSEAPATPASQHRDITRPCSSNYRLLGSLLVKEHVVNVQGSPLGNSKALRLLTKDALPNFHLEFETSHESREWQQAFREALPATQ